MDLSKLPPFMAMSLGLLGCITAEPCLSLEPPDTSTGTSTTGTGSGTGTGTGTDTETTYVGPCLSPPEPETTSTGPCLGVPMDSSGTASDSGTGTGTDTGTGTGTDTGTGTGTGGMFDEPHPTSRAAVVERVLSRGTLPSDVLDRLRALTGQTKGQTKG